MNIRYFEKRPGAWHLDFKTAEGKRLRPYGGATEAEARRAAPGILARCLVGPAGALPEPIGPVQSTVPAAQMSPMTIGEAFKLGLKTRPGWITSKSKHTLQTTFDSLALPLDTPVAALTRNFVRDLRSAWTQEPGKRKGTSLSPSTINHRLSMLSALLEVADLPPHAVSHLSVKGNRRTRRISDAELTQMQAWCAGNGSRRGAWTMGRMIWVALDCCARQGELLALTWADVGPDWVTFRDTKNSESRTVPLTPRAAQLVEAGRGLPGPFADLDADRITALWSDMRTNMGLATDEEFVFHTLRHEGLSRLADKGTNAFTIAAIAGHANITTTQVYVKASMGAMRMAIRDVPVTATDVNSGR